MFKTKLRRGFCALAALFFLLSAARLCPASAAEPIRLLIDGRFAALDVPPLIMNERAMVPARAVFEPLGGAVGWDAASRQVSVSLDGVDVALTIDSKTADVNGAKRSLDAPATIVGSRALVPLRFVSEAFGFEVDYYHNCVIILTENAETLAMWECQYLVDGKPVPPRPTPDPAFAVDGALSVTSPAKPNQTAAVRLMGTPNKAYSISVYYAAGKSKAAGLTAKFADENGEVGWAWRIGGNTTPGTYKIVVEGSGETYETTITIRR